MPDIAIPAKPMVKIDKELLKLIDDINVLRDKPKRDEWSVDSEHDMYVVWYGEVDAVNHKRDGAEK